MSSSISGLTEKQINKIVKYWSKIEKLENRIYYYGCYIKYENYINELGYQFSDRNQDEKLFQLINNGILI